MSKHLADRQIGVRAVEEIFRLFPDLPEKTIAKRLGLGRKTFWDWKCGMAPGGYALSVLCFAGCDMNYILTGRRSKNCDHKSS